MIKQILISIGIIVVIVVIAGTFFINQDRPEAITEPEELVPMPEETEGMEEMATEDSIISPSELSLHNTKDDCWVVYGGKVYEITSSTGHPNIDKTFFSHCGELSGFEEGAKDQHGSRSSESRVENYARYVGELG